MADRFPLIVNAVSLKIEELVSGDRLDLSGNGIVLNGDDGTGKYLRSDGNVVHWDSPGDVYLDQTQTLTNKTLETCIISGSLNTLTNIPNSALVNSGITVNGTTIALGGSVTTPDNNTTYAISAQDGTSASQKIVRLTSGGNAGAGIDDDIIIAVGSPSSVPAGSNALSLFLDRVDDKITLTGHVVDNNTITTLIAPGGAATSGAISFTSTGAATVSMTGSTINIDAIDTDTKTKIRVGASGTYGPADNATGNFTFLEGGATTITQLANTTTGDPEITIESTDNVTRIRGGSTGTYVPSITGTSTHDITITGGSGGNVTVSQVGNTISIDSENDDTITRLASGTTNPLAAGDFRFVQAGATTITQSTVGGVTTFEFSSDNDDTGATFAARGGVQKSGIWFQLKNYVNFSGNTILKWDSGNDQFADSIITDDGSAVTIDGDLIVQGNQTVLNTSILQVEDNEIELRKGQNLTGSNGGIRLNRTTDASSNPVNWVALQWYESGGYWRSFDNGGVENRFVTENEQQTLTNKILNSPELTGNPILGSATATTINGLAIGTTAGASFTVAATKNFFVNNDLTFTSNNANANVNVNFRSGGNVAYTSDTLSSFATTTSSQLRAVISDTTGLDQLVFQTSPTFIDSIRSSSSSFDLLNSAVLGINIGGSATDINIGAATGDTTINHDLIVSGDFTTGIGVSDNVILNGVVDVVNADLRIRGSSSDPMIVGRGGGAVNTNTAAGVLALAGNSSASQATAFGYESLRNSNGAGNTAYGYQTLKETGTGELNTAVGRAAGFANQGGSKNVAIGANALEQNITGDNNVCIGYYAGAGLAGSGNVLIGPATSGTNSDVTFQPPSPSGDTQLVIGSGGSYWIRGDANFDVTFQRNATINTDLTVKGNLVVNGTTTTVNSNIVEIADKAIELAAVVSTQFVCTVSNGSPNITGISPTVGLIPGMVVVSQTAGIDFGSNCEIVSITGNTAVLSNNVSGSGTPLVDAIGPSDTAADDGGLILNGTTNKTFLWKDLTNAWTSSEHMNLVIGKEYRINNVLIASGSQIGPSTGVFTLGAAVSSSSLTSVGTLTALTVSGNVDITGTGHLQLPAGNDSTERPGTPADGMIRYNNTTNVFEGYSNSAWGKIGGGASISSGAPTGAVAGDLWYDEDDGRLFVYYNDGTTTQWVDASPNGVPTDLVVEGTTTLNGTLSVSGATTLSDDVTVSHSGLAVNVFESTDNHSRLRIRAADASLSQLEFADSDADAGEIRYDHTNDRMTIHVGNNVEQLRIESTGNVEPATDATQDFGSATKRWANIYSADLQLSNEGSANEVDGTWGQYTIQEGEEDLFLINRRNGKKYKFNLTEVA